MIPKRLKEKLEKRILERPDYRDKSARLGAFLNRMAYRVAMRGRQCVRFMNHHVTDQESDWFVSGLPRLHERIHEVLARQRKEYGHYYYFYGHPYQALGILGVYGERGTEERFQAYGLHELVGPEDRVLDIGCNCGFMVLYTAYRTGCQAEGLDINPYMIEIGELCADYLHLSDKVTLHTTRIQEFNPADPYTVVFSFASHWTDDENYRVPLREHFERLAGYLVPGGVLVFETHAADVGNDTFYSAIETMDDLFDLESKRDTDMATRHLYVFRCR